MMKRQISIFSTESKSKQDKWDLMKKTRSSTNEVLKIGSRASEHVRRSS